MQTVYILGVMAVSLMIWHSTISAEELLNIAVGKPVMMSSTLNFNTIWNGSRMVDGNMDTDAQTCQCCASTDTMDRNPWITIDLLQEFTVVKIVIIGRTDQNQAFTNLWGLHIYVGDNLSDVEFGTSPPVSNFYFDSTSRITANGNVPARWITLKRPHHGTVYPTWLIVVCELQIFTLANLRNLARGKPVTISSTAQSYYNQSDTASAVDGIIKENISMCGCCVSTANESNPWLTVDLQGEYLVQKVVVSGRIDTQRTDVSRNLENIQLFNGNNLSMSPLLLQKDIKIIDTNATAENLNQKLIRLITIKRPILYPNICDEWYLTVCEIEIYITVCPNGTYGNNGICNQTCGFCRDGHPCDGVTGTCPEGCDPGYTGNKCNQECENGTYGINCNGTCGHCNDGRSCDVVTGNCSTGCVPGYTGATCKQNCINKTYGVNCNETCGYCLEESSCATETGQCPKGCGPGYRGDTCKEECVNKTYGFNCNETCGRCMNGSSCAEKTGHCHRGCDPGYSGVTCKEGPLENEAAGTAEAISPSITTVSVSVSVGVVAVVVAVIIIVFVIRRKRPPTSRYESTDNKSISLTAVESEYSEIVLTSNEEVVSEQEEVNEGFRDDSNEPQSEATTTAPKLRDYYNFDKVKTSPDSIYIQDLWSYIQDSKANNCNRFYEDYKTLPSGLQFEHEESLRPENKSKNRYREIVTYDHSRVVLHVTGADQTDYINASFIDGYERVKKFIASQGPMPSMINDFWRMIWQQNTTKIVMLTNLVEMGKDKCDRYWPEEEGEEEEYGEVRVRLEKQDIRLDFCIRTLTIQQGQSAARHVTQYHFNSWPDKDIPDSAWCLVNFWRTVTEQQSGNPIVVHCSAGVGRTGTFIALDVLYEQARAEGGIKPLETVERLRRQRIKLVQTKDQYVYLHEAVAEALLLGPQSYWPREVPDVLSYLQGSDPGASQTRLQVQYQLMCKTVEAMTKKNEPEYGNVTKLEVDENRPKVSTKPLVQDLKLNNFNGVLAYIVTLAPTEKTMDNLWTKLRHYGAKTIINISGEPAKHLTKIQQLGADGNAKLKKYNVYLLQEKTQKSFTVRTFDFKEVDRDDNALTTVKQYDITGWKSGKPSPDDVQSLPLLVDEIFRWQSDIAESQPLIITCSTDWTRCGLVVAIMNEALRMRYKDCRVNILDTVIGLKRTEGRFITYEQFEYLYDVVISCIKRSGMAEDSGVYSNI